MALTLEDVEMYVSLAEEQGITPLIVACSEENYDVVSKLVQGGADVNTTDNFGHSPLEEAVRYAYKNEVEATNIISLLLVNNVDVNAQNIDGETPLMQAAYYNYTAIARLLIENGANVNLRRTDGSTIISSIEAAPSLVKKRKRMIKILEEAGGTR